MTGRVDIRIFEKIAKKLKMKSQERKNIVFGLTIEKCDFNFNFFEVFLKMRQTISTLQVILSFMKFFVAQTSRT